MSVLAAGQRVEVGDAAEFGRVAVLYGGSSSEREVSLRSGRAVFDALRSRGVDAHAFDPAENNLQDFAAAGFDRAWIALHGAGGEDGTIQGALECLGVPYTGSGVMASALAMDKIRSKHLFDAVGIATPAYRVIRTRADAMLAAEDLGLPLVIKPAGQGSSVGMSKVFAMDELDEAIELALRFGDSALAETCIVGEEITVAVLQGEALPSIRIAMRNSRWTLSTNSAAPAGDAWIS
jgi:D-alanine-D-alanine ligase